MGAPNQLPTPNSQFPKGEPIKKALLGELGVGRWKTEFYAQHQKSRCDWRGHDGKRHCPGVRTSGVRCASCRCRRRRIERARANIEKSLAKLVEKNKLTGSERDGTLGESIPA